MFFYQPSFLKIRSRIGSGLFYICLICIFFENPAFAFKTENGKITDDVAVKIIVSEAADQGLKGMICVGEVIRHRNSTAGFYGYKSNRIIDQPKAIWIMAKRAWELSAHTNYTQGADHFENVRRFGEPSWARYCVKTYEYKDHIFYKETHLK
jgi:hypothetical protein